MQSEAVPFKYHNRSRLVPMSVNNQISFGNMWNDVSFLVVRIIYTHYLLLASRKCSEKIYFYICDFSRTTKQTTTKPPNKQKKNKKILFQPVFHLSWIIHLSSFLELSSFSSFLNNFPLVQLSWVFFPNMQDFYRQWSSDDLGLTSTWPWRRWRSRGLRWCAAPDTGPRRHGWCKSLSSSLQACVGSSGHMKVTQRMSAFMLCILCLVEPLNTRDNVLILFTLFFAAGDHSPIM